MSLSWYWPTTRGGKASGSEIPGFDAFGNDYLGNLAREVVQNSLDARRGTEPVKVEFSLFKTPAEQFPALEDFLFNYVKDWIDRDKNKEKSEAKERRVMDRIMKCFVQSQTKGIVWLRISDFNTTGLRGVSNPLNRQTPWFAFVWGTGKDVKGEGSGGSKGLGKSAIFLNSAIQTIFVSTSTDSGEVGNIGCALLVSKEVDDDGRGRPGYTNGDGYCVEQEYKEEELSTPNRGLMNLDTENPRKESDFGTDIYVPFFYADENWSSKMIGEIIISFLPAFKDGDLEVTISDPINHNFFNVKRDNLYDATTNPLYFEKDSTMEIAQELYKTLCYPTVTVPINLGNSRELTINISSKSAKALNRVYSYRWKTKMRIEVFKTNASIPYTAILMIKGDEICDQLKSVEDASHKTWEKQKWKLTDYDKGTISKAIDYVKNFAREELLKIEEGDYGNSSDFEWANDEGWNSEQNSDTLEGTANEDLGLPTDEILFDPPKKRDPKDKRRKPKKQKATDENPEGNAEAFFEGTGVENEEGQDVGSHPDGHNHDGGNNPHPGSDEVNIVEDEDGSKMMVRKRVSTISSKMPVKDIDKGLFNLIFTPSKSGADVEIEILKSGTADENEPVEIMQANIDGEPLEIKNNIISLPEVKKGAVYKIELTLKEHKIYVWEVNVYANE